MCCPHNLGRFRGGSFRGLLSFYYVGCFSWWYCLLCPWFLGGLGNSFLPWLWIWPACRNVDNLEELGVGEWEGMSFQDIRARYPVLYELRGKDSLSNVPPGGESFEHCRDRAAYGLMSLLAKTTGDIAVVTHARVNRILLTSLLSEPLEGALHKKQPYGCMRRRCSMTLQERRAITRPEGLHGWRRWDTRRKRR